MKITKRQLKRIIKEEKRKLLKEITPGAAGIAAMGGGTPADQGFAAARMDDTNLYVNLTPGQEDALGMLEIALRDCISRGVKDTDIQDIVASELER